MSLSQNQLKLITSLQKKKYRSKHKMFLVEGKKAIGEFLDSDLELEALFCVYNDEYKELTPVFEISEQELRKISSLKTPNNVLGIFKMKAKEHLVNNGLTLLLDGISDPGNLGTIIRLCDWFNVQQLVCSTDTVDCYNPKVVQASMGSLARVSISYTDVETFLENSPLPKYATGMEGENIYESNLSNDCILIMGNEANGVRSRILSLATNTITIPKFGSANKTESLNVGTATAVLLSEFRRSN